jgi:hypothetical protein
VSASNVQPALRKANQHLDLAYGAPYRSSVADPGIDDPVNDTGLGPRRGNIQLSREFVCLLSVICEGSGDFS